MGGGGATLCSGGGGWCGVVGCEDESVRQRREKMKSRAVLKNAGGLFCNFNKLGGTICHPNAGSQELEFTKIRRIYRILSKRF